MNSRPPSVHPSDTETDTGSVFSDDADAISPPPLQVAPPRPPTIGSASMEFKVSRRVKMARQIQNGDEFAKVQKPVEKADSSVKNFNISSKNIPTENLENGINVQKFEDFGQNFENFANFGSLNNGKSKEIEKNSTINLNLDDFDTANLKDSNLVELSVENLNFNDFVTNNQLDEIDVKSDNFQETIAKVSKNQNCLDIGTKSSKNSSFLEFAQFSEIQENTISQAVPQMSALRPDGSFDGYDNERSERSERTEKCDASPRSRSLASSSRRQSTEDSIDTDDEYFCYEMRQLEELERNSHMVALLSHSCSTSVAPDFPEFSETPDSEVHRLYQMVLDELVSIVRVTPPISTRPTGSGHAARLEKSGKAKLIESPVLSDDEFQEYEKNDKLLEDLTRKPSGSHANNFKKSKMIAADSADISDDDYPDNELLENSAPRRRSDQPAVSKKSHKHVEGDLDDVSDPDLDFSEHSALYDGSEGHESNSENNENDVTDNSGSTSGPDSPAPEPEIEEVLPVQEEAPQPTNDAQASKWRLLKTLKERKIEDQSNAEKQKEEEAKDKDKEKVQ